MKMFDEIGKIVKDAECAMYLYGTKEELLEITENMFGYDDAKRHIIDFDYHKENKVFLWVLNESSGKYFPLDAFAISHLAKELD